MLAHWLATFTQFKNGFKVPICPIKNMFFGEPSEEGSSMLEAPEGSLDKRGPHTW